MYPIGGFVFINATTKRNWIWNENTDTETEEKIETPKSGPYEILAHFRLYKGSRMYYDLKNTKVHYRFDELQPASKDEDLYHRMTRHITEE